MTAAATPLAPTPSPSSVPVPPASPTAGDGTPAGSRRADSRFDRLVARRLMHRSRSVAVSIALAPVAVLGAWVAVEASLAAAGAAPLLASPAAALAAIGGLDGLASATIAAGLAVLGACAVLLAVAPGRRGRRRLAAEGLVLVADDAVLASAVSSAVVRSAGLPRGAARTAVHGRRATIDVTPSTGFPLDAQALAVEADALLLLLGPTPRPRASIRIAPEGRLPR